jgi:hypothetical protein
MFRRILAMVSGVALLLSLAAGTALAANPSGSGQPNASCEESALQPQADLARGVAHATYYGRAAMTTNPARWQTLVQTGATCIVSTGDGMESGVAFGLVTLLGAARAEHFHDPRAAALLWKAFS